MGFLSQYNGQQSVAGLPGAAVAGKPRVSTLPGVDPTIPTGTPKWGATLHPEPYAMERALDTMQGIAPILGLFGGDDHHARIEARKKYFAAGRQARAQGQNPQANYLGQLGQL